MRISSAGPVGPDILLRAGGRRSTLTTQLQLGAFACPFRGHSLHGVDGGQGPPVVFLHNGGTSSRIWLEVMERLAPRHRVLALDHLGYGDSSKPEANYTLQLHADAIEAALAAAGIGPATLVGNCLGSAVALTLALRHPERVRGLVLCNTLTEETLLHGDVAPLYRLMRRLRPVGAALQRLVDARIPPRWAFRVFLPALFAQPSLLPAGLVDDLRSRFADPTMLRVLGSLLQHLGSFAPLDRARRPPGLGPVYSVWGEKNRVLYLEGGRAFAARLGVDRELVFEGCGHLLMCERPEKLAAVIEEASRAGGA